MGVHARFALVNRAAIEIEIERLIALLDAADGDCDLEDDDPAGDPLDAGEGEGEHGRGLHVVRPRYGVDQRRSPSNYLKAERELQAEMMGLNRTTSIGWSRS